MSEYAQCLLKNVLFCTFFQGLMSPRRKIVAETPSHKQVSQVLRHKHDSQEQQGDESEVVEESPEKQCQGQLWQY